MKVYGLTLLILEAMLFFGCNSDATIADEYLETDIKNRIDIINSSSEFAANPKVNTDSIAITIDHLILLSKDIENIRGCINKSNSYFKQSAGYFGVDTNGFINLKVGMRLAEINNAIKQNELNLLNRIILKRKPGAALFTAQ